MKKINVLISHVSYQACAGSFIKLLRKSKMFDCYIVGCDSIEMGYSSGSMLVDQFYYLPFQTSSPEYLNALLSICAKEKIDLIISAEEEDLIMFKKNKITQSFYQYIPDFSLFRLFQDKYTATMDIQSKGILIPKTIMNLAEFKNSKSDVFIYRKRVSCCSRGIKIFTRNEVKDDYLFFSEEHMVQEFLTGVMYTVDVLCDKRGNPCVMIPRKELSAKDGTTFKCIIEREEFILNICKKIYSEYYIPGLSNIQFMIENGQPYFIELNLRAAATMIASSLVSLNYLDFYIAHIMLDKKLPDYEDLVDTVQWGSIISRYYEETVFKEV